MAKIAVGSGCLVFRLTRLLASLDKVDSTDHHSDCHQLINANGFLQEYRSEEQSKDRGSRVNEHGSGSANPLHAMQKEEEGCTDTSQPQK